MFHVKQGMRWRTSRATAATAVLMPVMGWQYLHPLRSERVFHVKRSASTERWGRWIVIDAAGVLVSAWRCTPCTISARAGD
jgi:hypothetical protein